MKKTIFVILLLFLVIMVCIFMNYKEALVTQNQAIKFNSEFEFYNKDRILGTDITTLINKAINNNEKMGIPKNEKNEYIPDEKNSIKLYIHMIINETTYPMETLNNRGLQDFTKYFGEVEFKCTSVKYHKATGRIAEMTFEATQE